MASYRGETEGCDDEGCEEADWSCGPTLSAVTAIGLMHRRALYPLRVEANVRKGVESRLRHRVSNVRFSALAFFGPSDTKTVERADRMRRCGEIAAQRYSEFTGVRLASSCRRRTVRRAIANYRKVHPRYGRREHGGAEGHHCS